PLYGRRGPAGTGRARGPLLALPAGRARRRAGPAVFGLVDPHLEAAAVDLHVDLAPDGGLLPRPGGAGRRSPNAVIGGRTEAGEVDRLLQPAGRMMAGHEVGVLEDGAMGGHVGGHALDDRLADRPHHPA